MRPPDETVTEENYFFKLSSLQDRLLELYDRSPEFVQPEPGATKWFRSSSRG